MFGSRSSSIPVFPEYTCQQVVLGICQRATKSSFCWYQKSERDATLYCRGVSGQTLSEVISIPVSNETLQVQCTIRQELPPFPTLHFAHYFCRFSTLSKSVVCKDRQLRGKRFGPVRVLLCLEFIIPGATGILKPCCRQFRVASGYIL